MDELECLAELRDKGLITEKDFEVERAKIVPSSETIEPEPNIWKGYPGSSNPDQENASMVRRRPPAPTPAPSGKQSRLAKVRQKVEEAKQPRIVNKHSTWIVPRQIESSVKPQKAMFSCLDFETNGLKASDSRVLEVAIVRVEKGKLRESWTTLINPGDGEGVGRADIHGIKKEWLADAPTFEDVAGDILALIQGTIVVAHNAKFDMSFLEEELERAGISTNKMDFVTWDTMQLATSVGAKSKKLSDVAAAVGVKLKRAHQALDDATALAKIVSKVTSKTQKKQKCSTTYCGAESSFQVARPSGKALVRPLRR